MSEQSMAEQFSASETDVQDQENTNIVSGGADLAESALSNSRRKSSSKSSGAFRTISEVADLLDVQQHVLRFWETKFSQVKPLKRGGGRRYYRPDDVAILQKIHNLLYTQGYTIKGVQKLLKGQSKSQILSDYKAEQEAVKSAVVAPSNDQEKMVVAASREVKPGLSSNQRGLLEDTLSDLKSLREMVQADSE